MKWSSLSTFFSIFIPIMVILDAATIYHIQKIKDFQIRLWYTLSNMKPHYSAANLTNSMLVYLVKLRFNTGRLFFIYCFIFAFLYCIASFYSSGTALSYIGESDNIFLHIIKNDTVYFLFVILPLLTIHSICVVISVLIIIVIHKKTFLRSKLAYSIGFLLSCFLVSLVDIAAIMIDSSYSLLWFNILSKDNPLLYDLFRAYLGIPIFAFPFLIAPTLITLLVSIFLTFSWIILYPAKELAERVIYVQANNDKQGLFTYLAGFISAVVALVNFIWISLLNN